MGLARDRALELRVQMKVPRVPTVPALRRSLRRANLAVRFVTLGPEVYGVWVGRAVIINALLDGPDRVWAIGHELNHFVNDAGNHYGIDWVQKAKCDRRSELFAGHWLMGDPSPDVPAWELAERYRLPYERVARWIDLRAGWLAISSAQGNLERYRHPEREGWRASYEWRTPAQRMAWGR